MKDFTLMIYISMYEDGRNTPGIINMNLEDNASPEDAIKALKAILIEIGDSHQGANEVIDAYCKKTADGFMGGLPLFMYKRFEGIADSSQEISFWGEVKTGTLIEFHGFDSYLSGEDRYRITVKDVSVKWDRELKLTGE